MSRAAHIVRGLAAALTLAAAAGGLPVLLLHAGGSPLPRHMPSWHQIHASLMQHDSTGALFLAAVRDVGWLAWLAFTAATIASIAEARATARGRRGRRLPALGSLQDLTGRLVALITLAISSPTAALAASAAPAAAAAALAPAASPLAAHHATVRAATIAVRPGSCLWTIAQHYLGDGERWHVLYRLNHGRIMPNGDPFTSPLRLQAGFELLLPPGATGPGHRVAGSHDSHGGHSSASPAFSAPHQPAAMPPPAGPLLNAQPAASISPASTAGTQPQAAALQAGSPLSYAGVYAAGALTTGALATLYRMRHRQRQARRPGRRIRLPADPLEQRAEQRLRATGPAQQPQPLTLRAALRELATGIAAASMPLPGIAGLCVIPGLLEVLLTSEPAGPPPAPFTITPGRDYCWQLPLPGHDLGRAATGETGDLLPGLVTAGLTSGGGYLLLDLEPLRVTSCAGPAGLADQVLATVAAELATTRLCGWYDLLLVGFDELEVIDGRATCCASLDHALDLLAARARELRSRGPARQVPADIRLRRVAEPDGWDLTLLVSRVPPAGEQMARLLQVTSGGGIAALVAAGADGGPQPAPACIEVAADQERPGGVIARISPLNIVVRPQPLAAAEYQALTGLFTCAANLTDVSPQEPPYHDGGPPWLRPAAAEDAVAGEDSAGSGGSPGLAPHRVWGEQNGSGRTGTPGGAAPGTTGPASTLHVSVLGPFTVTSSAGHLAGRQAELVLALALQGAVGMTMDRLCYALGADPDHAAAGDTVRQIIARARTQAGVADDGRTWIEYTGGHYRLHEAATFDWDSFHVLAGRGMRAGSRDDLAGALALVQGEPFTDCFPWWLDTALIETVRALIVDAAEMLAGLDLAAGDPAASARAVRTGLDADPAAEQLWRALMRAEDGAGNLAGVKSAWTRCLDAIADIAPDGQPHPDTVSLYRRLTGTGRQAATLR
jgi:DNA-binding SARP family transcriptional activator